MKTKTLDIIRAWTTLLVVVAVARPAAFAESVLSTVHNLSVSGPGTIKASTESDACVFCHTVHRSNGATPLWNHNFSGITNYIVYSSPSLDAIGLTVPQPNGSSRLCLSCHDGTVALGSVSSQTTPIAMQQAGGGPVTTMPVGPGNLGTDLSGDHPISFVYDSNLATKDPQLKDPGTLVGPVRLDSERRLQCTTCHDPHNNQFGNFLVEDNTGSALCQSCHSPSGWAGSAHATSTQVVTPTPSGDIKASKLTTLSRRAASAGSTQVEAGAGNKTIAANGCANCHLPHGAGGKHELLKSAKPEQNCLPCHDGRSGIPNVAADFRKVSAHPVTQDGTAHNPKENAVNPSVRHVTCADCHNPHAATAGPKQRVANAGPPGALSSVLGMNAGGTRVQSINKEYELCFRCHADSSGRGPARVRRQFAETNTRLQFAASSRSFHPIETVGRSQDVPSLLAPWTVSSTITCLDCHNSDQNPRAGGTGANGPHGSIYTPLLERQLVMTDLSPETPGAYALCYKCHSRDSILSDRSFRAVNSLGQPRGHRFHIAEAKAACTTCHDSHGVSTGDRLINFNLDYVTPSSNGRIEYITAGLGAGNCSLTCHGKDHNATSYPSLSISSMRAMARHR